MIIFFQAAGLVNLLIVLFLFLIQRKIMVKSSKLFLAILGVGIINLFVDLFSLVMIAHVDFFGLVATKAICKLYLVIIIMLTNMVLIYLMVNLFRKKKDFKNAVYITTAFEIIMSILVIVSPIRYVRTVGKGVSDYTEGVAVYLTYATCASYIVVISLIAIIKRKNMNSKKRMAINLWILTWIVATIVQFVNNKIIVIGFALSIGILVVYVILENPAAYLDNATGLFNEYGLYQYVEDLYSKDSYFEILMLHLNSKQREVLKRNNNELFIVLSEWIKSFVKYRVFIKDDNDLIIVIPNNEDYNATKLIDKINVEIKDMRNQNIPISSISFKYVVVNNPYMYNRANDLLDCIRLSTNMINRNINEVFRIDESIKKQFDKNKKILSKIEYAIANDTFEVFYQPIYSFADNKFISCEALVRMRDRDGSIIYPSEFVPIAEENDSIVEIGQYVFESVCKFIASEEFKDLGLKYIEVNLSMIQFGRVELAEEFKRIMKEYNVDPKFINFEITETGGNGDLGMVTYTNMNELIKNGSSFSLDDFGTGNSNLNYIASLPVNIIKFDKKMVDSFFESGKARYIMDNAIKMVKGLSLAIVLEGIETKEQFDEVSKLGVDFIQGYYFSEPMPKDEFIKFIKDHNL